MRRGRGRGALEGRRQRLRDPRRLPLALRRRRRRRRGGGGMPTQRDSSGNSTMSAPGGGGGGLGGDSAHQVRVKAYYKG